MDFSDDPRLSIARSLAKYLLDSTEQASAPSKQDFPNLSQSALCDQLQTWANDLRHVAEDKKVRMPAAFTKKEIGDMARLMQQAADKLRGRTEPAA